MGAYVYMLRCSDGSYYVGLTRAGELEKRLGEHQAGVFPGYTSRRRPVVLVWSQQYDRIVDAIATERQLKGWTRAKKEMLIKGGTRSRLSRGDGVEGRAVTARGSSERFGNLTGAYQLPSS